MMEQGKMDTGITRAAWGYFFLYFDLTINMNGSRINILPSFVGMLLFYSSVCLLEEWRPSLSLLRPFAVLLAVWEGLGWAGEWTGIPLEDHLLGIGLLMNLVNLYFHFQLLTDFGMLAGSCGCPEAEERLLRWRTIQTMMLTVLIGSEYVSELAAGWARSGLMIFMLAAGIVQMIAGISLMAVMFSFRKAVRG